MHITEKHLWRRCQTDSTWFNWRWRTRTGSTSHHGNVHSQGDNDMQNAWHSDNNLLVDPPSIFSTVN
eukprot:m.140424 g.140424  ORF g.140424 m.140424 type:complete len:67 (+) comp15961_c2_seq11:322-522(+)